MVCNLSRLESGDIKESYSLIELGIDSFVAMEPVREVSAAFK
jgi:hypothetical protein